MAGRSVGLIVVLVLGLAAGADANPWAKRGGPAPGPAEAVGSAAAGCLKGAVPMPLEGPGFQVVGTSRKRFFGHPALVAYVVSLAAAAREEGLGDLFIGDLSQPRGGPMPDGHASHQSGLDVDILFDLSPKSLRPARQREGVPFESVVAPDNLSLDAIRFTSAHRRLLERAASSPAVERVFVHPAVKRALCADRTQAGPWLAKMRPWYGHDAHFHVRIACPPASPSCEAGPVLPDGDGCDETLSWWFIPEDGVMPARREVDPPSATRRSGAAPRPLPEACAAVLRAP